MNLPNRLTMIRILAIPVIVVLIVYDFFPFDSGYADWVSRTLSGLLFIAAAITDLLDGKIARKNNMVTDFGKFLDPLADKFFTIGALFALCFSEYAVQYNPLFQYDFCISENVLRQILFWASIIVLFRELAVTSIRLVVAKTGVVVPANILGKIKTNTQIVCVSVILLEPVVLPFCRGWLSLTAILTMVVFTVWSGVVYIRSYWKYLDPSR